MSLRSRLGLAGLSVSVQAAQVLLALLVYLAFSIDVFGISVGEVRGHFSMMAHLLEAGGDGVDDFFAIPVRFFMLLEAIGINIGVFSLVLGGVLTAFLFLERSNSFIFGIKLFLFIPAASLYLGSPSKELFMISFMVISMVMMRSGRQFLGGVSLVIYAIFFRYYYLPMAVVYIAGKYWRPVLLFGIALGLFLFALFNDELYAVLSGIVRRRDIGYSIHGSYARSAFPNLTEMTFWGDLVLNYGYAFLRINVPVIFSLSMRELFLQLYVILFLFITLYFSCKHQALSVSMLVMFLLYPLFEPDLGSYLRHISSLHPFLFFMIERVRFVRVGHYSPDCTESGRA